MSNNKMALYQKIYEDFKSKITQQWYEAHSKLPSIRQAAKNYGLSTTTIEHAYQQLSIEGYIYSLPKSGYYVEDLTFVQIQKTTNKSAEEMYRPALNQRQTKDMFNLNRIRAIMNRVLTDNDQLYEDCHPTGEASLKKEIQKHLAKQRDVFLDSQQIIVASGTQQLIMWLSSIFAQKTPVAYLKPGFKRALQAFKATGFKAEGLNSIDALIASKAKIIFISPSNLYPSGDVLPIKERLKLIRYAHENGAYIIEDDYNHIFRYNAYQIPTIHQLAKGQNVIYIGSFSRNTLLSLRMSYMGVPLDLIKTLDLSLYAQSVSKIDQLMMVEFLASGAYQKHLRQLARYSKRRNDDLKKALEPWMNAAQYSISGLQSNMHMLVDCHQKNVKTTLIRNLESLAFAYTTFDTDPQLVLIPYSGIPVHRFETVFETLFSGLQ